VRQREISREWNLQEQKRTRKEEVRRLKVVKEQMGPEAFQQMLDEEAHQKAVCELEAKIAYYKTCDEYRKVIAERKAGKSAARDDYSTPSYPKANCEYVPPSSPTTSYQNSGSSTPQSSANSPQSTTSDPSYGAAQTQRTQQDNNAIRRD